MLASLFTSTTADTSTTANVPDSNVGTMWQRLQAAQAKIDKAEGQRDAALSAVTVQQKENERLMARVAELEAAAEEREMELSARQGELTSLRSKLEAERAAFVQPASPPPVPPPPPPPAAAANSKKRPSRAEDEVVVVVDDDAAAAVDVAVNDENDDDDEEEEDPTPRRKARRSSVDASQLAMPVLQARLKALLGPKAKLPKKKADLLALYIKHRND